jgi:hypothetical protein
MHLHPRALTWILYLLLPATLFAQTPAPKTNVAFPIPLADATTAQAIFLPAPSGNAYLVYATSSGKLGSFLLSPITPEPGPLPPVPPVPPVPPAPTTLTIAIIENPAATTLQQRDVLSALEWRKAAAEKHNFLGIIPSDLIEKGTGKPPASLAPFLDRAKLHNLPWCIMSDAAGKILWEGQLPTSPAELNALIKRYGG